eukprot:CAMPEP_0115479478 /NCGR_PEP_ID=MMETSP0271-20121206/56755_1 /TAXON_ID=71861 /ORGANISM="Scrippsiella trochoidea, Strain CCMP3099" /LENGTH=106 /DNA_ID=CAMNT_0002907087 /DNA_START=1203 /DNA_END=1523 /DNA_ORIENTATION=-
MNKAITILPLDDELLLDAVVGLESMCELSVDGKMPPSVRKEVDHVPRPYSALPVRMAEDFSLDDALSRLRHVLCVGEVLRLNVPMPVAHRQVGAPMSSGPLPTFKH